MRLELSPEIEGDLDEIAAYIAMDSPRRAVSFLQQIRAEFERIGQGPQRYQLRPEIGEDTVRIERVVHGHRFLPPLFQ